MDLALFGSLMVQFIKVNFLRIDSKGLVKICGSIGLFIGAILGIVKFGGMGLIIMRVGKFLKGAG